MNDRKRRRRRNKREAERELEHWQKAIEIVNAGGNESDVTETGVDPRQIETWHVLTAEDGKVVIEIDYDSTTSEVLTIYNTNATPQRSFFDIEAKPLDPQRMNLVGNTPARTVTNLIAGARPNFQNSAIAVGWPSPLS